MSKSSANLRNLMYLFEQFDSFWKVYAVNVGQKSTPLTKVLVKWEYGEASVSLKESEELNGNEGKKDFC